MTYEQFREEFEETLRPFGGRFGLKPAWYFDILLFMESMRGVRIGVLDAVQI